MPFKRSVPFKVGPTTLNDEIVSFGDRLTVSERGTVTAQTDAGSGVVTSFADGISERPALTVQAARLHGSQVRPDPVAVYALFGLPLSELNQRAGWVTHLADLGAGGWGNALVPPVPGEFCFAPLD
jgi:hypothetical protein